jgi:hypothetical protein
MRPSGPAIISPLWTTLNQTQDPNNHSRAEQIMERKTLDRLLASGGVLVTAVLVVAGALLLWAHNYVHDQVQNQLTAQQIYFPPKGSDALAPKEIGPYLNKYAGQQLTTGAQAKAYADHFIAVHINEMTGGQTYAQLSGKFQAMTPAEQASAAGQKLNAEVQTVFRGETLRGLLLNAYAFDTMGNIALIAAIAAWIGAACMAVLSALGFYHAHKLYAGKRTEGAPAIENIPA